jgi:hypothetical protein
LQEKEKRDQKVFIDGGSEAKKQSTITPKVAINYFCLNKYTVVIAYSVQEFCAMSKALHEKFVSKNNDVGGLVVYHVLTIFSPRRLTKVDLAFIEHHVMLVIRLDSPFFENSLTTRISGLWTLPFAAVF